MAEEVHCVHILVKTQKDANHLRDRVLAGEDFGALAREYSSCPSREQGGDLGWFGRGQMVKPFENAAFKAEPGDATSTFLKETFFIFSFRTVMVYRACPA